MHNDSASLLANVMLITGCALAVGFMLWFLRGLTLEKNGAHVRCRMEFKIDGVATQKVDRQTLREVSAHSWRHVDFARPDFEPPKLVTHRAVRAVSLSPKARPHFVQ